MDMQALDIFIAWPTNLVKVVSHEDSHVTPKKVVEHVQRLNDVGIEDPLCQLIRTMYDIYDKPVELLWDGSKFGIPNSDASFFLTYSDVNEIMSGDQCLNIAILQLFMIAMKTLKSSLDGHIDKVAMQWIEIKWLGDGTPLDIKNTTTIPKPLDNALLSQLVEFKTRFDDKA
ncbi:hypothetical protein GmHk_09G025211 [Glycine max]|nr:hypothetical protein GmHk_09G025211 [Glycine max]